MSSVECFIPFGHQYYRWPTPIREDWEQDLKQIASMGFNTVKYFIQWRISQPRPDRFEFDDIQELMDIAHRNHLKVVINLIFDVAPAWFYKQYPESKMITADGSVLEPAAIPSRSVGGAPGPCFHHEEAHHWKKIFLTETVRRFKDHPALWVWDLWNEPELTVSIKRELSFANQVCYCSNCLEQFGPWLQGKYGSVDAFNEKWQRNYSDWSEVEPPRYPGTVNDMVDWRMYFVETVVEELRQRITIVKSLDSIHPVMCHTVPSPIFNLITAGSDDFKLAELCDLFGNSVGSSAWAADLLISAAKGKKIINSEIHSMWGDMATKNRKLEWMDLKKQILIPLSRGITGFIYWQYRPETLGLESPAWGNTYMDGSATPWLTQMEFLNNKIQQNREVICQGSRPSDQIAILFSDEGQIANFAVYGHLDTFEHSIQGIHKLLHDLNYKVEFIHQQDVTKEALSAYRCLWMPFPMYLNQALCDCIKQWVEVGGYLISECSFGALQAEKGKHSYLVPSYGFDEVFGVRERWISSVRSGGIEQSYTNAAILGSANSISINWNGLDPQGFEQIYGSYYQTEIDCSSEVNVLANFASSDHSPAITLHRYGQGKAVWIGTLLAAEYWVQNNQQTLGAVKELLQDMLGLFPTVEVKEDNVRVDYWQMQGEDAVKQTLYYVHNIRDQPQHVEIPIDPVHTTCESWFEDVRAEIREHKLVVDIESNDMQVFLVR